jgi:serine/threonine protein kinase
MPAILDEEKIGNFKIVEKIGEGGMAIIYKALQPSLKRTVVVKKLKDPNKEIIERFKKEALVSASFSQENVLAIYDFIYSGKSYYLVMEHVDGKDLRTIIDYFAPLPLHIASLIIREIAKGLEYTHVKGIIHRDIKPSNILISYQGDVKLIDFGVAKDETPSRLTLTGMIVGTPSYMSPEQANGEKISSQSDIYSLGVLLYEMVTGIKPFSGDTNTEVMMKIIKGKYTSPRKYNTDMSFKLARIIKKCLQKSRKKRYQNAPELIRDLNNYIPWQGQTHKKELLSEFLKKFNNLEDHFVNTRVSSKVTAKRNFVYRLAATIILLLGIYTGIQLTRYIIYERLLTLEISVNQPGAMVYLNKNYLGRISSSQKSFSNLPGGSHTLTVTNADETAVYRNYLHLNPGKNVKINARFPSLNQSTTCSITSTPELAEICINGKSIGTTPINNVPISNGTYLFTLSKTGYQKVTRNIEINKYKHHLLTFSLNKIE